MKSCGVCGGPYRGAGRRVVAAGRFRLACPGCAKRAVRVVQTSVVARCACGETASICLGCARRTSESARADALASSLRVLRAYLAAFQKTVPPEGERAYVDGVIDGLGRAIDVLGKRST